MRCEAPRGWARPEGEGPRRWYFILPTVLDNVPPQQRRPAPIFGPVLSLIHASRSMRHCDGQRPDLWQHGMHFHQRRSQCPPIPLRSKQAMSASTSVWPRRCLPSHSADGGKASSATCTHRLTTGSSFHSDQSRG